MLAVLPLIDYALFLDAVLNWNQNVTLSAENSRMGYISSLNQIPVINPVFAGWLGTESSMLFTIICYINHYQD